MKKLIYILLSIFIISMTSFFVVSCKNNEVTPTCEIHFVEKSINIDRYSAGVKLNVIAKQSGVEVTNPLISFSCDNLDVVELSQDGFVRPRKVGSATINATWNGKQDSCSVIVGESGAIPSLKSNVDSIGFVLGGETFKVLPYVYYLGESDFGVDATFTYSIPEDGKNVASVDSNGNVTPVGYGETVLIVSAIFRGYNGLGMSLSIPVRVNHDIEVHSVLSGEQKEIYAKAFSFDGEDYINTLSFSGSVSVLGEDNAMAEVANAQVSWHVSNQTIANISDRGVLTATKGGDCYVWCSYVYEGFEYVSEQIKIKVNDYLMIDKTNQLTVVLDESKNYLAPTNSIFGENFEGNINSVYLANGHDNLLVEDRVAIDGSVSGKTTLTIVNDIGYAYKVTAYVVAKEITQNDVSFYLVKNTFKNGSVEYSFILPELSDIEKLLDVGYNKIGINYTLIDGLTSATFIRSEYKSELFVNANPLSAGSFELSLCDLESRYNDFIGGYVFKILSDNDVKLILGDCSIIKEQIITDLDAKFERGFNASKNNTGIDLVRETKVNNIDVQAMIEFEGDADELPVSFSSSKLLTKKHLGRMINLGYDVIRVNYMLNYDSSKLDKSLIATTTYDSEVTLVANQPSYFDLDLRAIFAKHVTLISSRNNSLFDIKAIADDNGDPINYQFALIDTKFIDNSQSELTNVGIYSVNGIYYWSAEGDAMNVNVKYNEEVAGKTAQISASLDIRDLPRNGVGISCFYTMGITKDEILKLINDGYTSLIFNYYIETDYQGEDQIWLQTQDYFIDVKASYNKWDEYSLSLDYIYKNYESLNGASGYDFLIKLTPVEGISVYNFAIGNVELTKDVLLNRSSNLYEYCGNGPDSGFGEREDNVIVDGRTAITKYTKTTRNTEYGPTTMTANWRYNITESQVEMLMAEGKTDVLMDVYIGVENTATQTDSIEMAILANDATRKIVETNQWITISMPIEDFKNILDEGYTLRLWPVVDGAGGRNGTYSISYGGCEFIENVLPDLVITDESRVEERCSNGQALDVGNWDKETNVIVGGETALYNFYNITNSMGMGDTTMYAYLRYNYTQDNVTAQKAEGMKYVKFEVYFGIYDMRNVGAVAPETLDVALTDNDGTKAPYATNRWIEVYIHIDNFNTIVGNGGYTFKLYPVTDGSENHSGTYSIAIKSVSFVEKKPIVELNAIELTEESRVEERCTNAGSSDVGNWDKETDVVVGGETALYNFYNVTNSMGMGDTTMYAYLKYNYAQGDVTAQKLEGKNFVKFEVYFGIYDMRNSGAVAPETLDVALTDNDSTKASYATNKWIEVYIPIDDFNTIVGNGGYTFKLYPVTDGSENHSGTYSIAIKSVSFVESAQ